MFSADFSRYECFPSTFAALRAGDPPENSPGRLRPRGVLDLVFYFPLLLTTNPFPLSSFYSLILVFLILISVAVFRNSEFRLRNSD